jgi:hypothetical protein
MHASRQLGVVAVARALSGAQLGRRLPARLHAVIEQFRLECGHRLRNTDLIGEDDQVISGLTDLLLASLREPAVAADLRAAMQALLQQVHLPRLLVLGRRRQFLLPIPEPQTHWTDLVRDHLEAGFEEDLDGLWANDPECLYPPEAGQDALVELLGYLEGHVDVMALRAYTDWALKDAQRHRAHGVRGSRAYVSIAEPQLMRAGLTRAFLLRETSSHIVVRCDWDLNQRRCALRIPRSNSGWDRWADSPGGALLAAYLAGAYRDMVVSLDLEPFAEERVEAPRSSASQHATVSAARLQPVGYIPQRHHSRRRTGVGLSGQRTVAPHGVTWYIRRLPVAHRPSQEAMTRAAAVGMVLPRGYTFVDAYVWPRMADVRSLATALRTTIALSSLRAIIQADQHRRGKGRASETDPKRLH